MKGREPEWPIQTKSVWNYLKCPELYYNSYPPSEEMPENQEVLNVQIECSEMNLALTPTLGGVQPMDLGVRPLWFSALQIKSSS